MRNAKILFCFFILLVCFSHSSNLAHAQESEIFILSSDALADKKPVQLYKNVVWKYRFGDDAAWAAKDFDDAAWQQVVETRLKPEALAASDWNGRAWFRLQIRVDENLAAGQYVLFGGQSGASEIYLDGQRLARFGTIGEASGAVSEYNPNNLPIPIRFEGAGEHTIAVRFASATFAEPTSLTSRWLLNGGVNPGFWFSIKESGELSETIDTYAQSTSMRFGFFFVGILISLALLHFLLYLFYRVERANLFYSIYAASFGIYIFCNNLTYNGHFSGRPFTILRIISGAAFGATFIGLLAFVYVAFSRRLGKIFWAMTALWALHSILSIVYLTNLGALMIIPNILIGLSFFFSIFLLVKALREKRPGAWILLTGVQLLAFGMFSTLFRDRGWLPGELVILGEFVIVLAVPIAVSIYLARNFARTNRNLTLQLAQVEQLSRQKIEQERTEAELRAENERRAKELEEARHLQLSMLPKKLPQIPNLEIAAYMKPATEVGGDYYDFHTAEDGTLTVAVGDATGHGLKAGTVVTATKSLFANLAPAPDIPDTLKQISRSLKQMNLRGLFMALALLKIKDGVMTLGIAGMPSALIYRAASQTVEEISIRAMPLGSIAKFNYKEREVSLAAGDCVVLMSDGFPEMFNRDNQMLGFEKAAEILPQIAGRTPQEIINHFVETAETWANGRPQDDDVTFVILKIS